MPGRRDIFHHWLGTSFEAKHWLSLDPCGCCGVTLSWSVHLYAFIVLAWKCVAGSVLAQCLYGFVYVPSALLAWISLWKASTTNPGAVPWGAQPLVTVRRCASTGEMVRSNDDSNNANGRRSVRRCHKCCDNYKPSRAHHDSVTGRCIVKFDHFCPWVNNSIGALNHKFFCLFLLYTALSCTLSLILIVIRMIHCGGYLDEDKNEKASTTGTHTTNLMDDNNNNEANSYTGDRYLSSNQQEQQTSYLYSECKDLYSNHLVTILAICSLVFLLFTTAMGWEQLEAIETGKGKIARMQQQQQQSSSTTTELLFKTVTTEFNEMFGGDTPHPTWHWYLPVAIRFPRGMRQVVLGYECHETTASRPNDRSENGNHDDDHEEQQQRSDDDEADALLLRNVEAGLGVSLVSPDNNNIDNKADEVRRSPYTGLPVEPLPLVSRRSNSRSRSLHSQTSSASTNHENSTNSNDEHGITLVDRTKARVA